MGRALALGRGGVLCGLTLFLFGQAPGGVDNVRKMANARGGQGKRHSGRKRGVLLTVYPVLDSASFYLHRHGAHRGTYARFGCQNSDLCATAHVSTRLGTPCP